MHVLLTCSGVLYSMFCHGSVLGVITTVRAACWTEATCQGLVQDPRLWLQRQQLKLKLQLRFERCCCQREQGSGQ